MASFDCVNCPEHCNLKEGGCPLWWEQTWEKRDVTNPSGEVTAKEVRKGCGAQMVQEMLLIAVNTMEIPIVTLSKERNDTNASLQRIEETMVEHNKKVFGGLLSIAQSFDNQQQKLMSNMLASSQDKVIDLQDRNRRLSDGSKD